jgi:hypothetical protein
MLKASRRLPPQSSLLFPFEPSCVAQDRQENRRKAMKTPVRYLLVILVIGLGTTLWATSPESSKHFVLTNDNDYMGGNYGTRLKLLGNGENLSLVNKNVFATGGDLMVPRIPFQIFKSSSMAPIPACFSPAQ